MRRRRRTTAYVEEPKTSHEDSALIWNWYNMSKKVASATLLLSKNMQDSGDGKSPPLQIADDATLFPIISAVRVETGEFPRQECRQGFLFPVVLCQPGKYICENAVRNSAPTKFKAEAWTKTTAIANGGFRPLLGKAPVIQITQRLQPADYRFNLSPGETPVLQFAPKFRLAVVPAGERSEGTGKGFASFLHVSFFLFPASPLLRHPRSWQTGPSWNRRLKRCRKP